MVATSASVSGAYVGTSGFSYPSWRGGFYPPDADPKNFLSLYAARFDTVELNTTGYRLPAEEQFTRWAEQTPDGFRFAVKMPVTRLDRVGTFVERVRLLGDRLGPLRVVIQSKRDDGLLTFLQGSLPPELEVAYDFRHESWDRADVPVRVDALDGDAPFRYVRLREPPYDDEALVAWANRLRPLLDAGTRLYCFFKHEDEPTAPRYAERLLELLR
ncbi:MAG TPA: DUF72 domain-containing protein [Gaiellaceae bacterium]|nr:DUF72 domain-containing protein [Gaiellaceae bacterium]